MERQYGADELRHIFSWLLFRKPFSRKITPFLCGGLAAELSVLGYQRSPEGIQQMLERTFASGFSRERILVEMNTLYERQDENFHLSKELPRTKKCFIGGLMVSIYECLSELPFILIFPYSLSYGLSPAHEH